MLKGKKEEEESKTTNLKLEVLDQKHHLQSFESLDVLEEL
jgi:hypothetical protein